MKFRLLISLLVSALLCVSASAQQASDDEIAERIKPIGQVHIAGAVSAAAAGPRSGKEIYDVASLVMNFHPRPRNSSVAGNLGQKAHA